MSKVRWAIIGTALLLLLAGAIYLTFTIKGIVFQWARFLKWMGGIIGAIVMVWGVSYGIYVFFRSDEEDAIFPKQPVSSHRVIDLWIQEFAKATKIPYIHSMHNQEIRLADENDIKIRNEKSYTDPSYQTADTFLVFDAIVRNGTRIGAHVVTLRTDRGEDWIRQNWNWRMKDDAVQELHKPDLRMYPLTNHHEDNIRTRGMMLQRLEEGYTPEELHPYYEPFFRGSGNGEVKPLQIPVETVQIKRPKISDAVPEMAEDEEEGMDEIAKDIKRYRERAEQDA